jgi:hypothetical protein
MTGLVKVWHQAAAKTHAGFSNKLVRHEEGDKARINKAVKGVTSISCKALEINGLEDLNNPEILKQMPDEHPEIIRQIAPNIFNFVPEDEKQPKSREILRKLSNKATTGPTGLRNIHIKMWMGAFESKSVDNAIEHMDDLITDMANSILPP